jgi:hypothetical protein
LAALLTTLLTTALLPFATARLLATFFAASGSLLAALLATLLTTLLITTLLTALAASLLPALAATFLLITFVCHKYLQLSKLIALGAHLKLKNQKSKSLKNRSALKYRCLLFGQIFES